MTLQPDASSSSIDALEPVPRTAVLADRERVLEAHARAHAAADEAGLRVAVTAPPDDDTSRWLSAAPSRAGVLVEERGRVLAAVAGLRSTARVQGEEQPWGFLTEVFGEDSARGRAALSACLMTYGRAQGGQAEGAAPVLLATVSCPAVHHVLRDTLRFEVLRDILFLEGSARSIVAHPDPGLQTTREPLTEELLEALVTRALESREVVLTRPSDLRRWRGARPLAGASSVLVRRAGLAVACASLRVTRSALVLEDWLVAPDDHVALRALVRAASEAALDAGHTTLLTTCADTQPEWPLFQAFGFFVRPARSYLLARTWKRPVDPTWLYERWSYTPADLNQVDDFDVFGR